MDKKGFEIIKWKGKVIIKSDKGEVVMQGRWQGLYIMDCVSVTPSSSTQPSEFAFTANFDQSLDLWHQQFAHIHENGLCYATKHGLITGLALNTNGDLGPCNGCAKGKHHQAPFPKQLYSQAEKILNHLHMDLQGPFNRSIQGGFCYTLGVIDDCSQIGWKWFLHHKSDTAEHIRNLITELETGTKCKVKIVCVDWGGEFFDAELQNWFKEKGIVLEISAPNTHQQNGVAEWFNQTIHECALAILKEAGMANGFWPQAHLYVSYTHNWSPTWAFEQTTPYKVFYGHKPDVSTLQIFGSQCHVWVRKSKHEKLNSYSIEGVLCGFAPNYKAYNAWIPSHHKFVVSQDVIVYKKLPEHDDDPVVTSAPSVGVIALENITLSKGTNGIPAPASTAMPNSLPTEQNEPNEPTEPHTTESLPILVLTPPSPPSQPHRSEWVVHPTWLKAASDAQKAQAIETKAANKFLCKQRAERHKLWAQAIKEANVSVPPSIPEVPTSEQEVAHLAYMAAHGKQTPMHYWDAIQSPDASHWQKAMDNEIDMLTKCGTWELESLPKGWKAVSCHWTYTIKADPEGEITRYKAQLCVQGYLQIPGIDFNDTYAPTVHLDTLCALFHLVASHGWYWGQDDATGTFLNSDLTKVIYMQQPEGYNDGTSCVMWLIHSLYRLKQAAHYWNKHMDWELTVKIDFSQIPSDAAVYVCKHTNGNIVILAIHVDNVMSFGNTITSLQHACLQLHKVFDMTEENPNWVMGFKLIEDRDLHTIAIDHSSYIDAILCWFNMAECDPVDTPMVPNKTLLKFDCPTNNNKKQVMSTQPYWELIGALP